MSEPATDDVAALPLERKVAMLSGDLPFWTGIYQILRHDYYHRKPFVAAAVPELGLPGVRFTDGPRGVVLEGGATTFPVSMARGATWDPALEERIGDAIGKELRSLGANLFGGVCVNLLRHPAWGRAQETYGEDPHHVGAMGAALVRGVQRHAIACVKHFTANSMENARFQVDVRMSARTLHEIYLPHFKACLDAGAMAVMSAYNAVDGDWCGQSAALLTGVLRERWGFDGIVLTDWIFGMRDAKAAIEAGQDLEMPFRMVWSDQLTRLVRDGTVEEALVDRSVRRLARVQRWLPDGEYGPEWLNRREHHALAREAAVKSITLLKNESVVPLAPDTSLVVLGALADRPNLGDRGSSDGRPAHVVTPLAGLRERFGARVQWMPDLDTPGARDAVASADVVLAVVGYTEEDEGEHIQPPDLTPFLPLVPPPEPVRGLLARGPLALLWRGFVRLAGTTVARIGTQQQSAFGEGGDREQLTLRPEDEAMLLDAATLNPALAVAIMGGSAVIMEAWKEHAKAILMLWYPGMEGGHALADILDGTVAPSGRLPFSIPASESQLPFFDKDANTIEYDLWHGYRKLAHDGESPAFPFGFGLTTTTFEYGNVRASLHGPSITLQAEVTNAGPVPAEDVVQVYVEAPDSTVERAPRTLVAFARVAVEPHTTVEVTIDVPVQRLAVFDEALDDFRVESGRYRLVVARHAHDQEGPGVDIDIAW